MEGKTDRWDRMMHSWVMAGEESWGRRVRRRNGGREGGGGHGVQRRGAEAELRGRRKGEGGRRGRHGESVWPQRHKSPGRENMGRRTQGRPAGPPAAPQEAECPQRSFWNPPRVSTITTGAPTFHTHAHTCVHTLALAASHGHPHQLSRPPLHPQPQPLPDL